MIRVEHLLCPVDFSEFSSHAVHYGAALARWYEARLTVLHVFQNKPVMDLPVFTLEPQERERLTARLRELVAGVQSESQVHLQVHEAYDVHTAILEYADETATDLIVMGSHGRSGFERLVLGSVTEKVVRKARCPTLVVPAHAPDRAPTTPVVFSRILCPVDFSDASLRALEYAVNLAEESDAHLTLVNVIEVPPEIDEFPLSVVEDVDQIRAAAEAERLRRLRALIPEGARTYCTVETSVQEGAAYRQILRMAAETGADLIVMGVQGRGALDRFVFGSNTARVARGAVCPVLMVPMAS